MTTRAAVAAPAPATSATLPHVWLLVLVSLAMSLSFLTLLPPEVAGNDSSDYVKHYEPVARNLLAGRGIVESNGELAIRYPPGYPLILAGLFRVAQAAGVPEPAVLTAASVVGMIVSTLLVFLLARRIWGDRAAWFSGLAWATYPLALYFLKQPNSEIPFVVVMLLALWCVIDFAERRSVGLGRVFAAGALIGIAMLIRPIAIGLGFVVAGLIVVARPRRSAIAAACVLLLGNLAAIAPWEAWIYNRTESVIMLSSAGPNALRDGLTFSVRSKGFRSGTWTPAAAREVMQSISDQYPTLTSAGAVGRVLRRELAARPLGVVELIALKAARSWYGTDSQRREGAIVALQTVYLLVLAVATVRAWRLGGVARRLAVAGWTIVAYFWGMTIMSTSLARYMVPVMSLLFVLGPAVWCRPDDRGDDVQEGV